MKWIENLFKRSREESSEQLQLFCSVCMKTSPAAEARVIPWWNNDSQDFLTTYRCGGCFIQSLAETRSKISLLDTDTRRKFCEFLERHDYIVDAGTIREAPLDEASRLIGTVLDAIESGEVRLSP
jgi:hypothetical protein